MYNYYSPENNDYYNEDYPEYNDFVYKTDDYFSESKLNNLINHNITDILLNNKELEDYITSKVHSTIIDSKIKEYDYFKKCLCNN